MKPEESKPNNSDIPIPDEGVRYSVKADMAKEGYDPEKLTVDEMIDWLIAKYGKVKQGENPARDVAVPKKTTVPAPQSKPIPASKPPALNLPTLITEADDTTKQRQTQYPRDTDSYSKTRSTLSKRAVALIMAFAVTVLAIALYFIKFYPLSEVPFKKDEKLTRIAALDSKVLVYPGPSLSSGNPVTELNTDDYSSMTFLGECKKDSDKENSTYLWYKVSCHNKTGWVRSDFVEVRSSAHDQLIALQKKNDDDLKQLTEENQELQDEIDQLLDENEGLLDEIDSLNDKNSQLIAENKELSSNVNNHIVSSPSSVQSSNPQIVTPTTRSNSYLFSGQSSNDSLYKVEHDPMRRVWVTREGTKYHYANCPTLENSSSKHVVTLQDALKDGRQPCSLCHEGRR